tara:strand:- start:86 stop:307 length:222 start_codon:yes stop_codon:yes gene_type:complete
MSKKAVNISVRQRGRNDSPERMIKRFMKKVKKERILEQYRENQYYEKPSVIRTKNAKRRKKVLEKLREKEKIS